MCNPIYRLFGIEKVAKDFRGSNAAAKAWLREDFAQNKTFYISTILTSATALLLRYVHVAYGKIAARQARGYVVLYEAKLFSAKVLFFI